MGPHRCARALPPLLSALLLSLALSAPTPAGAQEDWRPFAEPERRRPPRSTPQPEPQRPPPLSPMEGLPDRGAPRSARDGALQGTAPAAARDAHLRGTHGPLVEPPTPIERSELPPIEGTIAVPAPGVVSELWRGLDAATFERLVGSLELPPRSPALHGLWQRLIAAEPGIAPADEAGRRFLALRAEAAHRSGLLDVTARLLSAAEKPEDGAVLAALLARTRIAQGDSEAGCPPVRSAIVRRAELPPPLKSELILLSGYCAAAGGNASAAGLAADLARDEGVASGFGLALLDAIAAGGKPQLTLPRTLSATEYRLLQQGGLPQTPQLAERAAPALLAALAVATDLPPRLRLAATEIAARLNIVGLDQLAEAWRAEPFQPAELAEPLTAKVEPAARRALLFHAAERERNVARKTRLLRAVADDARRAGLLLPALALISRQIEPLTPVDEIAWFAETAVEAHLAAGAYEPARRWIAFSQRSAAPSVAGALQHWLALADIADARLTAQQRGASLESVESLALRGRYGAELLHRLATVLDALDYHVPIPLWEAASRTPQPAGGHLPATGVLSELQDAARKGEQGRTTLLVMQALGASGAEGAHLIALGDAIRALKRARLEADARRLAFEALFAGWPRTANN